MAVKSKQGLKQVECCKCGKKFKHMIPEDAENVTCFECYTKERK